MLNLCTLLSKASKVNRNIEKELSKWEGDREERKAVVLKNEIGKFKKDIYTLLELKNAIEQIEEETGEKLLYAPEGNKQAYFITIRPDLNKIVFKEFYKKVKEFTDRKCFKEFKLSFEQKGTEEDTLGEGFHVHIVANMRQRSKGEVLRDTQNTFKDCTAPNCIEVLTTKNPQELVDKYLTNYESEDGHKEVTKHWDDLWRRREGLLALYTGPLPIKSGLSTAETCTTITFD